MSATETDYAAMTTEEFDAILTELVDAHVKEHGCGALLTIGTIYEDLSEEFNNAVLDEWTRRRKASR